MKEYDVKITETLEKTVTVQAESHDAAEEKVRAAYYNSEYILDSENFTGVAFGTTEEREVQKEQADTMNVLLVKPFMYPQAVQIGCELEDLQKAVTEKRFRQDLLYRLQEYVITMPPLRDCPEDIMPLAEFFREMANRELEREVKGFAASARNALLAHAWPGNVRELKQKIQTAVLQSEGDMITEADLELDNEPSATSACFTLKSGDEERGRILRALKQAAGNKKMAAKILGIGRTTLYNKLVEYGLNEEN